MCQRGTEHASRINLRDIDLDPANPPAAPLASVTGGSVSSDVTLTANGFNSDIVANTDTDAITAEAGNINLTAGRDIAFGTLGANFDNDVRARGAITINAGRDVNVDGFSDIASDGFGLNTGGNLTITAGHDINVLNSTGTDGSIGAEGSAGADAILTTGPGGFLRLLASSAATLLSSSGGVIVSADWILVDAASGISAPSGQVVLRPATAGREIIVGSGGDTAFALELSDADPARRRQSERHRQWAQQPYRRQQRQQCFERPRRQRHADRRRRQRHFLLQHRARRNQCRHHRRLLGAGRHHPARKRPNALDRIIYNAATGALIYDFNGSAAGGATQFATLSTGLAMTNADFFVV